MTPKQNRFLAEYSSGLNATEAAMRVYDCKDRDTARAIGSENLAKLNISEILGDLGLTDRRVGELVMEGLNDPDSVVRYRYLILAIKLKGLFETTKQQSEQAQSLNDLLSQLDSVISQPSSTE
jgi:hypothetical protein